MTYLWHILWLWRYICDTVSLRLLTSLMRTSILSSDLFLFVSYLLIWVGGERRGARKKRKLNDDLSDLYFSIWLISSFTSETDWHCTALESLRISNNSDLIGIWSGCLLPSIKCSRKPPRPGHGRPGWNLKLWKTDRSSSSMIHSLMWDQLKTINFLYAD